MRCEVYSIQFAVCSVQCAKKAVAGQGAVTGLGVLEGESAAFLYAQTQLAHGVSVLFCSRVIEFVVTGCSVGGRT